MHPTEAAEVLGISLQGLDEAKLKSAYRQMAQKVHPDKGGSAEDFIRVRKAFTTLRDYLYNGSPKTDYTGNSQGYKKNYNHDYSGNYQSSYDSTNQNHTESENTAQFWQSKYQEIYYQLQQAQSLNTKLKVVNETYEGQFNKLIMIFNTGQELLSKNTRDFQDRLDNLDIQYNEAIQKLKKKARQSWGDMLLGRKKMTQNEYILANNQIVNHFQELEQAVVKSYYTSTQTIYSEIMSQFYNTLSE